MGEALDAFLMAERLRLAESTLQRYRNVITLFRIFLENSEVQAAPGLHADVEMMAVLAEEFVNGFLANKLARGESTWRNAATVMRRLLRWLDDRLLEEYTPDDGVDKTSTEVTAAVSLHDLLAQHLGQQPPVHAVRHRRDVFIVARTEPGADFCCPQLPVAIAYLRPFEIVLCFTAAIGENSLPSSMHF